MRERSQVTCASEALLTDIVSINPDIDSLANCYASLWMSVLFYMLRLYMRDYGRVTRRNVL